MKLIDIHTHIYPDEIASKAAANVRNFYQIGDESMNGTVDLMLSRGTEAGISHYVALPVAVRPDRVRSINRYILNQVQEKGCFSGFGTVHADMEHISEEVEWIYAAGLKGIKIHPDCQRFPIDDLRLFPMYDAARGRLPIMLHMGDNRYDYSHPIRLRRVLELFPGLQVIAAHFGGYSMYETACEQLKDTSCVFDLSSSLMFMPEGVPERYINLYGAERIAFGTDYPVWDPVTEVNRFLSLKLTDAQREQIGWKTAAQVLKL